MIFVGKSPYRVSLLGGGSDLDWFVKKENFGVCLGYSLDKYSYSILWIKSGKPLTCLIYGFACSNSILVIVMILKVNS